VPRGISAGLSRVSAALRAPAETASAAATANAQLGETIAMALANLRRYNDAASVKRQLIAGAVKASLRHVVRRESTNLKLSTRGESCRTPWADGRGALMLGE
jgi:hypothetical protein